MRGITVSHVLDNPWSQVSSVLSPGTRWSNSKSRNYRLSEGEVVGLNVTRDYLL